MSTSEYEKEPVKPRVTALRALQVTELCRSAQQGVPTRLHGQKRAGSTWRPGCAPGSGLAGVCARSRAVAHTGGSTAVLLCSANRSWVQPLFDPLLETPPHVGPPVTQEELEALSRSLSFSSSHRQPSFSSPKTLSHPYGLLGPPTSLISPPVGGQDIRRKLRTTF